jgi:hypothetical protein
MLNIIVCVQILAQNGQTVELRVEKSFPNVDDEVLLAGPTDLDTDESGNIYICDFTLSTILKFSPTGEFLASIGKAGQGPGEFTQPSQFDYENSKIYINDQANRRIQLMTTDGGYISDFKVFSIPDAFTVHQGRIFSVHADPYLSSELGQDKLIWILNEKGKRLSAFGSYLDFADNLSPHINFSLIKVFNDSIYILFVYYPILRVYSLEGKLQQTIHFDGMNYAERVPENYEWEKFHRGNRVLPFKFLFRAFDVNKLGFFVGLYNPDGLIIDQFDHHGNFMKRFTKEKKEKNEEKYSLRDFKVVPIDNDKAKFLILNEDGIPTVDVCFH